MIRKEFLLLFLLLPAVLALQPSLPTLFSGTVVYDDGTLAEGVEVRVQWTDSEGFSQSRITRTGDSQSETPGQFSFADGYVLASQGSEITLHVQGVSKAFSPRPGARPFALEEPILIPTYLPTEDTSTDVQLTSLIPVGGGAYVEWETSIPSRAILEYGVDAYTGEIVKGESLFSQSVMIADLNLGEEYRYQIHVEGPSGQKSSLPAATFTSSASTLGISDITLVGDESLSLSWKTSEEARCLVGYGQDQLDSVKKPDISRIGHSIQIIGLEPLTTYNIGIICYTASTSGASLGHTFTTKSTSGLPQLPTIVHGVVEGENGPLHGIKVRASWVDGNGIRQEQITTSLSRTEAVILGDESLAGHFYFREEQIIAAKNTPIVVDVLDQPEAMGEVRSIPGSYVEVHTPLLVKQKSIHDVLIAEMFDGRAFFYYGLLALIFVLLVYAVGSLINFIRVHLLKEFLVEELEARLEQQFPQFTSLEDAKEKDKASFIQARMKVLLIEQLIGIETAKEVVLSKEETRVIIESEPNQFRTIAFTDMGETQQLRVNVRDVGEHHVVMTFNDIPQLLFLEINETQRFSYEVGRMKFLYMTVLSIEEGRKKNTARILFKVGQQ